MTEHHPSVPRTHDRTDHRPARTALVLGGGGSAGNAWLIGVVAGLVEAGLPVHHAALVVGTSAGATAAAQITSADPAALLRDIVDAAPPPRPGAPGAGRPSMTAQDVAAHMERTAAIIAASTDAADMRRRMGAAALELAAAHDPTEQWRRTVAARLPSPEWPRQRILLTAVDARTGEPVELDRHSGVELVDAVAASCSSGAAYRIGGARYIDGGYRANAENADLATGYERVLVLAPFGGRSRVPAAWGTHLATQLEELRAGGSRVELIVPDPDARAAFGGHAMDPASRPPAARAGHQQGRACADRLAGFWG